MQKIATCCYCGTRAALVLRGKERHELSCSTCGAPLHDMKMLRSEHSGRKGTVKPSPVRRVPSPSKGGYVGRTRKKKRKNIGRWFLEEAWDAIEDIFD